MRQKLAAFQNSRAGQFFKKVMDDRPPAAETTQYRIHSIISRQPPD